MTEPTTELAPSTGGPPDEAGTFVRVAPSPVTDSRGQRTGDRAGDKVGEGGVGGVPRADVSRDAPARDRIIAALAPITQRQHAVSDSRLALTVRDRVAGARRDLAGMWLYVRDETWMRDSSNAALRLAGYLWAATVALPLVALVHLIAALVALAADVVVLVFFRYARGIAAVAIAAAVVWVWPFSTHEAPPPTAATEVIQGGAR